MENRLVGHQQIYSQFLSMYVNRLFLCIDMVISKHTEFSIKAVRAYQAALIPMRTDINIGLRHEPDPYLVDVPAAYSIVVGMYWVATQPFRL